MRQGSLVCVLADHALPRTPVYLVFPDQRSLPRKVRVAIDPVCSRMERYLAGGMPARIVHLGARCNPLHSRGLAHVLSL